MIFTQDYPGLILHATAQGIQLLDETKTTATLRIEAGEPWQNVVLFALQNKLYGLENLAYIPGSAGGAPVQNIGAFGVELAQWLQSVDVVCLKSGRRKTLDKQACHFGYRDSLFKQEPNCYFIERIHLTLPKQPTFFFHYDRLAAKLSEHDKHNMTAQKMIAIIQQLRSHLPNPKMLPNAGSFFKNPVMTMAHYQKLKNTYPNLKAYPVDEKNVKCAAGWLIQAALANQKPFSRIYPHPRHALILTHEGQATATELKAVVGHIQKSIQQQFEISLMPEVQLV